MAAIDAKRAMAMVGVPFRPQGRDKNGLDCVGLCLAAYRLPIDEVRADYRLRGNFRDEIEAFLTGRFREVGWNGCRLGDLIVMQVRDDQMHIGIRSVCGFVHADARLRRVVETPGGPEWPVAGVYRRIIRRKGR